jgi:hypothetical protein
MNLPAQVNTLLSKLNRGFWLFALLIAILLLQIFQITQKSAQISSSDTAAPPPAPANISNDIFSSQTATIRGKIISMNGNKFKIENNQKVSGEFEAGRVVLINDNTNLTVASSSADLKKIETNKDSLINLLYADTKYVITSITYQ